MSFSLNNIKNQEIDVFTISKTWFSADLILIFILIFLYFYPQADLFYSQFWQTTTRKADKKQHNCNKNKMMKQI